MEAKRNELSDLLYSFADIEQVAAALNIKDLESKPEEFWEKQRFAAHNRTFYYCLCSLGLRPSMNVKELDEEQLDNVLNLLRHLQANEAFSYTNVREWFKIYGEFVTDQAFKLRREKKALAETALYVLFVFKKGASYLAYNGANPVLVSNRENAFKFPVQSVSETSKDYLADMAKHFKAVKEVFNAEEVKILVGSK